MWYLARCAYVVFAFVVILPATAGADPIGLVQLGRSLDLSAAIVRVPGQPLAHDAVDQFNGPDSATAHVSYDGTTAAASGQATWISDALNHVSGTVIATASVDGVGGYASSWTAVDYAFEIVRPLRFAFVGAGAGPQTQGASWSFWLRDSGRSVEDDVFRFTSDSADSQAIFRGSLDAGSYWLRVAASADASSTSLANAASYDFTFDMTPVPEPASMGLTALGVLALAGLRRRRS